MSCPARKCQRPGCGNAARKRAMGVSYSEWCSQRCASLYSRARKAALPRSLATAPRPGQDEGPDAPLNGWTVAQARARRDAIAVEMLREGWSAEDVLERFRGFEPNITALRQQHGIPTLKGLGRSLPAGFPAR